ncbi:MAG: hypothetical protein A3F10_05575 [Coxiella sp. RIFCSPHIGHO2_12_FULL_42_15]|nr:MAG: hypothetical protein A3F10_05575 [Coxiella sp. RIFCSPHIGHO2_12_FULL_42_15]
MNKRLIKYGGAITGLEEERAIIKSIRNSRKTRNWQEAEEGKLFSSEAAKFLGVKYGVLTNSGSSAGLLALSALDLSKGSEVIISAVTFPTIFNIILQCGLVPVVVDAKVGTYGFDIKDVKKAITKKTKAIIAIHPLGNPVDMSGLMKLVKGKNIYVIEDNCDGWGSSIGGRKVGSFGDISITSFHAAHIVSMGVGGGVFTNNKALAQKVRMYRDWGRQADINKSENKKWKTLPEDYNPRFIYEKIGYNFQILELQAAMGRVQLRKANDIKKARKKNFDYLTKNLAKFGDLILPSPTPGIKNPDICWFSYPITTRGDRGALLRHLEENGIETRPLFSGNITRHPAYTKSEFRISGDLTGADLITRHSFWISCHPSLTKSDLKYIVKTFDDYFK